MLNKSKFSITKFQWITPILVMIFYIYLFGASWSLKAFANDILGSDFMPKVVTALGFLCTLYIFIEQIFITLREKKDAGAVGSPENGTKSTAAKKNIHDFIQQYISVITLILIGIYISLMRPLGFILSTILYLFVQILLIAPREKKKPVFIAILSIAFSFAIYTIFTKGFYVILPPGILSF
ncbi:MAG: tripartite tricarboxylate transporter TctB family protein [Oscillospiraceae bacterium]